jgi:uncharacterized Tic20 family protein
MTHEQDPFGKGRYRAEDLGPSGFDPHAPYTPVEPYEARLSGYQPNTNDKNLALLAHLLGCLGVFSWSMIGFLGPLVIWLTQKDKSAFVEEQAREALNFQITLLVAMAACAVITFATCWLLFPIAFVPPLLQVIFGIIATFSVYNGKPYHYPFNLRLIK